MESIIALFSFKGLSPFDIFVQIIGYIGLLASIIGFQCKRHRNIMIFKSTNEILFAVQYLILGAYTGTAMNIISSSRNILFGILIEKKKSTLVFQIAYSIFFVIFGIISWQGYISLLLIAAKIVTTVAYGIKNTRILRFMTLPTSCVWLYYNFISHTAAGVLCESLTLISLIVAISRLDIIPCLFKRKRECCVPTSSNTEQQ